jgi:UDP-N-acetylmuramoyl-tripeptide--D-alanyl-D-alanine ligase
MKNTFKQIVIKVLHLQSRLVLLRFKPKIIAVVGSVGKTSTKDAIYTALKDSLYIRKNQKSFGSEIGVPLTILGFNNAWNNYFMWAWYMISGFFVVFSFSYPKWLVIEAGIDRPGDMDVLGKILKLNLSYI